MASTSTSTANHTPVDQALVTALVQKLNGLAPEDLEQITHDVNITEIIRDNSFIAEMIALAVPIAAIRAALDHLQARLGAAINSTVVPQVAAGPGQIEASITPTVVQPAFEVASVFLPGPPELAGSVAYLAAPQTHSVLFGPPVNSNDLIDLSGPRPSEVVTASMGPMSILPELTREIVNHFEPKRMGRTFGATVLFPGESGCKVGPSCNRQHTIWPEYGDLSIAWCEVRCQVCGEYQPYFAKDVSNLRRHVQDHHCLVAKKIESARLYDRVFLVKDMKAIGDRRGTK